MSSVLLTFSYGLIKAVIHTIPPSAKSFATSEIRRMFSSLSSCVKPRFLLSPVRILSPSKLYAGIPWLTRYSSRAKEMVVLPAPERPVNQTVHPLNPALVPRTLPLLSRETLCSWYTTLVARWTAWNYRIKTRYKIRAQVAFFYRKHSNTQPFPTKWHV